MRAGPSSMYVCSKCKYLKLNWNCGPSLFCGCKHPNVLIMDKDGDSHTKDIATIPCGSGSIKTPEWCPILQVRKKK